MDSVKLSSVLAALRFTAALPVDVLERLAASATLVGFAAGTVLFREGCPNDRLMIISAGRVALEMRVPDRGEIRILTLGSGDMVAWSALFGGRSMTASAVAVEDTQVVSIPAAEVLAACESNHTFGYYVMRQMGQALSERLVATRLQLLDLFSESPSSVPLASELD